MANAHFMLHSKDIKKTLSEYVTLTALYRNNRWANAPHCYDIGTLSAMLIFLIKTNSLYLPYDTYPYQILRTICNSIKT